MSESANRGCVICGEVRPERFKIWFDAYLKLYKCLECGFVSQYPGPGGDQRVTDYEDRYSLRFLEQGHEFMYPHRRLVLEDIADRIAAEKPSSRILDVGCGDGHFLFLCKQKGFDCYGIEYSKDLAGFAAKKTGIPITQGEYSPRTFAKGMFDVVTMIQVLEHIPDPTTVIETVKHHLKDDGIFVVEVPSITAPHFLAYRWTGIKRFVAHGAGVIRSHCSYFSPRTLRHLLDKNGFEQISMVTGRWGVKYRGALGAVGKFVDPLFDRARIGGILYMGHKHR